MSIPIPTQTTDENSYTAMQTADVEAIGSHCQMPFCRQLDFLPFRCDSCKSTYCLDHRSETSHSCPKAGEWARNRRLQNSSSTTSTTPLSSKPTILTAQQCNDPSCKTFINTTQSQAIHCQTCNRQYCLKHRFPEDHACKTLTPLGARPASSLQSNADKIKQGFGRLRVWSKDKQETLLPKPKPKPSSKAAQIAALTALKRDSKGDAKIPLEKRVHLYVEASPLYTPRSPSPNPSSNPSSDSKAQQPLRKPLFFSADHPIGRLLDDAAKALGVENVNNRAQEEDQRLRVYHVESGSVLGFGEKVGGKLKSGDTVVLLRGVGDPSA